ARTGERDQRAGQEVDAVDAEDVTAHVLAPLGRCDRADLRVRLDGETDDVEPIGGRERPAVVAGGVGPGLLVARRLPRSLRRGAGGAVLVGLADHGRGCLALDPDAGQVLAE